MGHVLLRAPIKDLVEARTKEEERKMSVIASFPPYDILGLIPLRQPIFTPGTEPEKMRRGEAPDRYDLLVNDREILTLVVTTKEKIDIWELDSQDAWSSMSAGGRKGVPKQWTHILSTTAPFKGRFVAEIDFEQIEGGLSLRRYDNGRQRTESSRKLGVCRYVGVEAEQLAMMLKRFAEEARALLENVLPAYRNKRVLSGIRLDLRFNSQA